MPIKNGYGKDCKFSEYSRWFFSVICKLSMGVWQGNSLICLLFNLCLNAAIRESEIQSGGTIFNQTLQILDDLVIIGVSATKLLIVPSFTLNHQPEKWALWTLWKLWSLKKGSLLMNRCSIWALHIVCSEFVYLGTQVNKNNYVSVEIIWKIQPLLIDGILDSVNNLGAVYSQEL